MTNGNLTLSFGGIPFLDDAFLPNRLLAAVAAIRLYRSQGPPATGGAYQPSLVDPLPRHPWRWADASDALRQRITDQSADMEVILDSGCVLWIPRGWFHAGNAGNETSLHITLRPEPVSIEWIAQRLIESVADSNKQLRGSAGYRSMLTPVRSTTALREAADLLVNSIGGVHLSSVGLDLWRSHSSLFGGPVLRPVNDICMASRKETEGLWFRPEAVCGYWRKDNELHLHLGTARKILNGLAGGLVEGLIEAGDHVPLDAVRDRLGSLIEWPRFSTELRALGLLVHENDLPAHWISRA